MFRNRNAVTLRGNHATLPIVKTVTTVNIRRPMIDCRFRGGVRDQTIRRHGQRATCPADGSRHPSLPGGDGYGP